MNKIKSLLDSFRNDLCYVSKVSMVNDLCSDYESELINNKDFFGINWNKHGKPFDQNLSVTSKIFCLRDLYMEQLFNNKDLLQQQLKDKYGFELHEYDCYRNLLLFKCSNKKFLPTSLKCIGVFPLTGGCDDNKI